MRVLIISDIHANFVALETVMADAADRFDAIWCLGDVVGYGPAPNECVDFVRAEADLCVIGNHDWAVLGRPGLDIRYFNPLARAAVEWTQSELNETSREFLDSLPAKPLEPEGADSLIITHASPREPVSEYVQSPEIALENFSHFETKMCLVGHTHKPAIYRWQLRKIFSRRGRRNGTPVTVDLLRPYEGQRVRLELTELERLILNPGSVGQPRDNDPRAAYALLDLEELTWEQRRVAYPIDLTQSQMRVVKLPRRLIDRLTYGS
ncbi:MAG: metallophosphoesterase family protein [Caldilineaceae bacterium]|nr:metallophosphoesterase family protein [Caldilineaceae bacterium]